MKKMSKFNILPILFSTCIAICLTSCEFSFNGSNGEVAVQLTELPVPEISKDSFDQSTNTVSWYSVSNCDGYTIRINNKEMNVNGLSYTVYFEEEQQFTFSIKARGKALYTSDSKWSETYTWTYKKAEIDNNGNQGVVTLSTPTNINYGNNTITWSEVTNSIGYEIKITVNGVENIYTTPTNNYNVKFDETTEFKYAIRALGDGTSYTNSNWTVEGTETFTKQEDIVIADSKDKELASKWGLGYGYDFVDDVYIDTSKNKSHNSIFDMDKLLTKSSISISNANQSNPIKVFEEDIYKFTSSLSTSLKMGVSLSAEIDTDVTATASESLSVENSIEYSNYKKHGFMAISNYVELDSYQLVNYGNTDDLAQMLSNSLLNVINRNGMFAEYSNEELADYIIDNYGTHAILGVVSGGRLDYYYSYATNEEKVAENFKAKYNEQAGAKLGDIAQATSNFETSQEIKVELEKQSTKLWHKAFYYGGEAINESDVANSYSAWGNSVTQENAKSVALTNNGAISIAKLIEFFDSGLAKCIEDEISERATSAYYNFTKGYDYNNTVDYAGGSGTQTNPFLISTAEQLYNINLNMSSYFELTNDIDLSVYTNWNALGGHYREQAFTGSLDGKGYKINNLNRTKEIAEKNNRIYFGLFGYIGSTGKVKNIVFENVDVNVAGPEENNGETRVYFGVVAGTLYGTVENVTVNSGKFSYDICTNGVSYVGSIAGYAYNAKISDCTNNIDLTSGRYCAAVGGIVGKGGNINFKNCRNNGILTAKRTGWLAYGHSIVGGIIGEVVKTYECTYNNCTNIGNNLISIAYSGLIGTASSGEVEGHIDAGALPEPEN